MWATLCALAPENEAAAMRRAARNDFFIVCVRDETGALGVRQFHVRGVMKWIWGKFTEKYWIAW